MKLYVVAIFDVALGAFNRPAFVPSVGVAVRGFTDEVNRPESEMRKHPGDYQLYELGLFDDEQGRFSLKDLPERLITASDVLVQEE